MVIKIKNIKTDIIIGTLDHERVTPQPIEIDIEYEYDSSKAADTDDFKFAVDYKELTDKILEEINKTEFFLVESLVLLITDIMRSYDQIYSGKVTVRKPKALKEADHICVKGTF